LPLSAGERTGRRALDQIQAMKDHLHAEPETVSCAGVRGAAHPASRIDSAY
jgi:hypothetical protein